MAERIKYIAKQKNIEVAKRMKAMGLSDNLVAEAAGLTVQEVGRL